MTTATVQDSLFDRLICVHCHQAIDATGNYQPDPPAHVHCAFRSRQATPWPAVEQDATLRHWLHQIINLGYAIIGRRRDLSADVAEAPSSPRDSRWRGYRAVAWDDGDRLPWLAFPDCPGPPYLDAIDHYHGSWQCSSKHWHRRAAAIRQSYASAVLP